MLRALYTATSASIAKGNEKFDMLAQNLANVDTPGFRAQYINQMTLATQGQGLQSDVQVGRGELFLDTRQGQVQYTGEKLDVDLEGDTYLVVTTGDGQTAYSRNGRLKMQLDGAITDRMGNKVMGQAGPLTMNPSSGVVSIDEKGNIFADNVNIGRFRTVSFDESAKLKPIGGGLYAADPSTTPKDTETLVTQGYYERSNVSPVEEMVRIIDSVRSVESYTKMIQTVIDETTGPLVRQTGKVG